MHDFLATAVLLTAAVVVAPDDLRTRVESAPGNVEAFIGRRAGCNHFLGEEPYDKERAAELARAIRDLRCARLVRDEHRLRRAYRNSPMILQLLDETADILGW